MERTQHISHKSSRHQLGIRWTIGDVTREGFEALQLSILGAWKIFASSAFYSVCVNSIPAELARERTGSLPVDVDWREVSRDDLPAFLQFGQTIAEGTGWKFCPLRAFEGIPELALDNDCILWSLPPAMGRWLNCPTGGLIAEDVRPHFGRFASRCGAAPRNSGIRGLTPSFPFERLLAQLVQEGPPLETEGDEQGLQVACMQAGKNLEVVSVDEVSICSPFPPHAQALGKNGVHFVGLNTKQFNWSYYGRDPAEVTREHWHSLKPAVEAKISTGPEYIEFSQLAEL